MKLNSRQVETAKSKDKPIKWPMLTICITKVCGHGFRTMARGALGESWR